MSNERKTAPNALWAYLLQKDLPASSDFSATPVIPPVAPVDRTNTSMRMLIHDMQATLERFSTRVDTLLVNVKDAKTEVANCNRISESERERILDEITSSSKKVQNELKACIGAPSQASALELIQKSQASANISIQALDKRIDAIQTVPHIYAKSSLYY
ncbi:hypothetical protein K503DRAFT_681758 [Rhizopogon vinicolor AM-OR11-026]|uniref:Uncharacterized protein n=1 Tax=Rhizopogon vinicolor AM-OR11-026 TaxID=1314800 RepID=A0A1B7NEC6_9AGAM|nr:hypothetical protein K503DRAFT_681758 [Rhizopogon vinicolor AM-OR11-026]